MKAFVLFAALAATASLAPVVHAEQKIHGLTQVQLVDTLECAAWSGPDMVLGSFFAAGVSVEEALRRMQEVLADRTLWNAAEVERRVRAIYADKPTSFPAWSRGQFQACLAERQVPLERERAGRCYMHSHLLVIAVHMAKDGGISREEFLVPYRSAGRIPELDVDVVQVAAAIWDRDGSDSKKTTIQDLKLFLRCAAADAPASSDDAAPGS